MIRNTKQRSLIMQIMERNIDHPTADEVYERARIRDTHISRGTVYRNLNGLAECGELRRISMPEGPDHYDSRIEEHYHFVCRGCNKVVDVELPYHGEFDDTPATLLGYCVEHHRLILVGLCPECGT